MIASKFISIPIIYYLYQDLDQDPDLDPEQDQDLDLDLDQDLEPEQDQDLDLDLGAYLTALIASKFIFGKLVVYVSIQTCLL